MTPEQQHEIVSDLILAVRSKILNADIPAEWDGFELRQYIADKFAEQVGTMDRTRLRNYRNTILTRNL